MSGTKYLKCPCRHCGGPIEFPAPGIGVSVPCPHCGQKTTLFAPSLSSTEARPRAEEPGPPPSPETATAAPGPATEAAAATAPAAGSEPASAAEHEPIAAAPPRGGKRVLIGVVALAVAAAVAGVLFRHKLPGRAAKTAPETRSTNATSAPPTSTAAASPTTASNEKPPVLAAPKSIDDLKAGPVTLERTKGSSLIYAVGTLRNESDQQRFGVKIELELTDARGNRVGTAKDYRAVLEARQEWRFRALVLDAKATAARVGAIREDE